MDVSESESRKWGKREHRHFTHRHPLFFIRDPVEGIGESCYGCGVILDGSDSRYGCKQCKFYLDRRCMDTDTLLKHPFHPQHELALLNKSSNEDASYCDFCNNLLGGLIFECDRCKFYLHTACAWLQLSIASNFPISLHQHPLFYVENHIKQIKLDCSACETPLSDGPVYYCSDCPRSGDASFILHKECAELPLEINHHYDRNHPLILLPSPSAHPHKCSCYLCKFQWKGFVYSCSLCNFDLTPEDVSSPRTITNVSSHPHSWILLSRRMSFFCDFCGTSGDHTPYLCTTCDLLVHKKCISLPRKIMITRHRHVISHSYSLHEQDQIKDWICRICYEEVNMRYGGYYCSSSKCDYIVHVHCATQKAIWDGTIIPDDYDESSMEVDSSNLITHVFEQMMIEEQMVAMVIKHAYHDHNLRLFLSYEIKDDDYSQCDGCTRSISTPFYRCGQCSFFLHKDCAELPKKRRHPFHKHLLTLIDTNKVVFCSECSACNHPYEGFSYKCDMKDCESYFSCDIRCIQLSDTLNHPSHEHALFLVHNRPTNCSGCLKRIHSRGIAYKCVKHCDFTLDMQCVTKPLTAPYKYDRHPLTLTYSDDSSPSQHFCDLCEEERDPNDWFYHCTDCDNSLHSKCALGDPQFLLFGTGFNFSSHPHPLWLVKNIWNCPPCKVCSKLCNGPTFQCEESKCNYSAHGDCIGLYD